MAGRRRSTRANSRRNTINEDGDEEEIMDRRRRGSSRRQSRRERDGVPQPGRDSTGSSSQSKQSGGSAEEAGTKARKGSASTPVSAPLPQTVPQQVEPSHPSAPGSRPPLSGERRHTGVTSSRSEPARASALFVEPSPMPTQAAARQWKAILSDESPPTQWRVVYDLGGTLDHEPEGSGSAVSSVPSRRTPAASGSGSPSSGIIADDDFSSKSISRAASLRGRNSPSADHLIEFGRSRSLSADGSGSTPASGEDGSQFLRVNNQTQAPGARGFRADGSSRRGSSNGSSPLLSQAVGFPGGKQATPNGGGSATFDSPPQLPVLQRRSTVGDFPMDLAEGDTSRTSTSGGSSRLTPTSDRLRNSSISVNSEELREIQSLEEARKPSVQGYRSIEPPNSRFWEKRLGVTASDRLREIETSALDPNASALAESLRLKPETQQVVVQWAATTKLPRPRSGSSAFGGSRTVSASASISENPALGAGRSRASSRSVVASTYSPGSSFAPGGLENTVPSSSVETSASPRLQALGASTSIGTNRSENSTLPLISIAEGPAGPPCSRHHTT